MKIQYRIPAAVTGTHEKNYCEAVKGLWQVFKLFRKAKKEKAVVFSIFF